MMMMTVTLMMSRQQWTHQWVLGSTDYWAAILGLWAVTAASATDEDVTLTYSELLETHIHTYTSDQCGSDQCGPAPLADLMYTATKPGSVCSLSLSLGFCARRL